MEPQVQPLRYALVGGLTAVTYFALTLLFAGPLQLPIQVAMICGYTIALAAHFSGQRLFVSAPLRVSRSPRTIRPGAIC